MRPTNRLRTCNMCGCNGTGLCGRFTILKTEAFIQFEIQAIGMSMEKQK